MLRHLAHRWVWVVALAVVATGEWLRSPAWHWVIITGILMLVLLAVARRLVRWRTRAAMVLLVMLVAVLALAQHRLDRIEHHWPEERESRIEAASRSLQNELHDAFELVEKLADEASAAGRLSDRDDAFAALASVTPNSGPEVGLTVLGPRGEPWAWSGRHRLRPDLRGDSLDAQSNGYYVLLESRRHSAHGRIAMASVLVWAHPAVPDRGRSLAELFRSRHEVGLVVYPPGAAPSSSDVFDYQVPTTAGPRLLFSLQPLPPEQGSAKQQLLARADRAAVWLTLILLGLTLVAAARPRERYLMLVLVVWLAVRAPLGQALHLEHLFSKATFFRPELGPLSSSAGILALTATLVTVLGVWLWRRRLRRSSWTLLLGAALLGIAPYLVSLLGRGITPPATGVSIGLWLTWQLTLVVTVSALIVVTAALFRSAVPERRPRWRIIAGVTIAVAATVVGIFVWSPRGGWPEWYPFLWTPALLLVTLPAPRWPTIIGIGLVAGSAAALVTWGAELTGRLQVVQRDVARLGAEPDALALPLLNRFADQVAQAPAPTDVTQLYALWRGSDLGRQNYPADLALWTAGGQKKTELALDSLDLPDSLLSSMVARLPVELPRRIVQLVRVPGVHYVMVARLDSAAVLTAAIGPRSELIEPSRLGRLLDPRRRGSSLYQLSLSPPGGPEPQEVHRLRWRRDGWNLLAEQTISLPGGLRDVRAVVDLRGPLPLFVRGILVVILDVLVLALLWYLSELVAGARFRQPRWRGLARSFRIRLAVTLAVFFLVPALGFAAWSFARLSDEAQRGRDLLITQTLRDAVVTNQGSLELEQLSQRIDADLALYRGGELIAASAEALRDLGIVDVLMSPPAFRTLAFTGATEVTRRGPNPELGERIGYRVLRGGPDQLAVLATPQLADESGLAAKQLDLALVLLLATIAGFGAAVAGAQTASRALSRPVSELRRAALALGQGQTIPLPAHHPPLEFEPVFGAFARMANDIEASRTALEEARRRTATVLGTVATGVVGLDPEGRILIANRQAVDLLGVPLTEGERFQAALPGAWRSLRDAVGDFLASPQTAEDTAEFSVGGRRYTLRFATLGPQVRGVVLALSDVTEVSRAERVLAWGEMARQVAHEIKNPLTPMRLGVQHLRRVWRDHPERFGGTLEETSERILAEIARLDTIARAFSRFAAPTLEAAQALDRIDLATTVSEVVQLYRLAGEGAAVQLEAEPGAVGLARADELKEVLVNLLENARNAGARQILVRVRTGELVVEDDGEGIPAALLPRIFEPRFSTTTSGSGLGLPIVRRLVESWGGTVTVESERGRGTRVTVQLTA